MVQGVREMCDVCDATLFNHHWACGRCGFVVCVDCYRSRLNPGPGPARVWGDCEKDRDSFSWLLCTTRQQHELQRLMLVQIIPGLALEDMAEALGRSKSEVVDIPKVNGEINGNSADVKLEKKEMEDQEGDKKPVNGDSSEEKDKAEEEPKKENLQESKIKSIKTELEHFSRESGASLVWRHPEHLSTPFGPDEADKRHPSVSHAWLDGDRVLQLNEGSTGTGGDDQSTIDLFREAWLRGRPVLVAGAGKGCDSRLWCPQYFSSSFGDINADFVNVSDGSKIANEPLRFFWEGFSDVSKRRAPDSKRRKSSDEPGAASPAPNNNTADADKKSSAASTNGDASSTDGDKTNNKAPASVVLKICDWPPSGDEFGEVLQDHARDLQSNLPLPRYTSRRSPLNAAGGASLPEVFVRSDLGPRPCFAQGMGPAAAKRCSVSLHSEVTDTVSLLLNCASPQPESHSKEDAIKLLEDILSPARVDAVTRSKVTMDGRAVGCVWQVFLPTDADKVRDYLNKTSSSSPEADFDPVHEADRFLSQEDLRKLREEPYSVVPFNIVQFVGEAVMVPAGAPRQVQFIICHYSP